MNSEIKKISFDNENKRDFHTILKQRVNHYFKENNISQKSNFRMNFKALFLMSIPFLGYGLLLSSNLSGLGMFALYAFIGFFLAIGTMNIAHDGLHGAYASRPFLNRILGLFMDICGASSFYWKKEHTVDHHTYTNIAEHDADLDVPFVLRLCPSAPYRPFHRFQNWYAPILYSLNLIHWVFVSDFKRLYRVIKSRNTVHPRPSALEIVYFCVFKIIHITMFAIIPMVVLPFAWWNILIAYFCMLSLMGITLTIIFQLAHIVDNVAFPEPNNDGKMENSFLHHQLETTCNFGMKSKLVTFLFGGLNYQIEHHLFPNICHIHLPKIAPIVQATAKEFGLPYHENPSFFAALRSHFGTLKKMGVAPYQPAPACESGHLPEENS